jgi:lipoteichoic acid synthase
LKDRITSAVKDFVPLALLFIVVVLLLRFYEFVLIVDRTSNSSGFEFMGLLYDLPFVLSVLAAVFVVYFPLSFASIRAARVTAIVILSIFIMVSFSVIQYFSVTLLPLSSDLFSYTLSDIRTTVNSSGGFDFGSIFALATFVGLFIAASIFLHKKDIAGKISIAFGFVVIGLMFAFLFFSVRPAPEAYESDVDYYLTVNKTDFFIQRAVTYASARPKKVIEKNAYPFSHRLKNNNTLGKYFNLTAGSPNIVFIIVEGLGRDFTGPGASYGGFTPFLDSLSAESLYWPNALSNAGRTFGVLPSILGSLPYGKEGFLSYGSKMPPHHTLISLLKPYGYKSNFFYGGNSGFDNMENFLEYDGVDLILNEEKFPPQYKKMAANTEGFSWGFADDDVFDYATSLLAEQKSSPRIDIYLTLSTHEPFAVPDKIFDIQFDQKLKRIEERRQPLFLQYRNVFSCLSYTDRAIKNLIERYSKLPDYDNTIFIITGDHRLIPVPPDNKLSRFHVPLIIYSPIINSPETFNSIVAHSSVTPSLLALLRNQYKFEFPAEMSFISDSLTTDKSFSSVLDLALIRNKSEVIDYIDGTNFLSEGRLFKISPNLDLEPNNDQAKASQLQDKLDDFVAKSIFAVENNKLDKSPVKSHQQFFTFSKEEDEYLTRNDLQNLKSDDLFAKARGLAIGKSYKESRIVARYLLNEAPNYHDARVLLARTFAWDGQYDTARYFLNQVLARSPAYSDAYVALIDMEYWNGSNIKGLELATKGLAKNPDDADLLAAQARALFMLDRRSEAKKIIDKVLSEKPGHELALDLKRKLK